ncbi:hypothetical protein LOK49_LG11G01416 [Camellia lanceoleosa]|uniref:Uncharacterized protein n=1 Tax=Camellia lanceoleosa TaxID=1840588 RepID=A0ACC0G654_9ERIC|nr:hypothetical protein LOK49_LG11G01416 [Camellia lanceoleosa]
MQRKVTANARMGSDESWWRYLNRILHCVSSTTDGKYGAIQEIEVESVSYLETAGNSEKPIHRKMTVFMLRLTWFLISICGRILFQVED